MKGFLVLAVVLFFAVTIVMATVFRDQRAAGRLRFIRKIGYAYVIAVVVLAAWSVYKNGF
ncbi:MAG: hypothetical protein ABI577_10420 [bacterium]